MVNIEDEPIRIYGLLEKSNGVVFSKQEEGYGGTVIPNTKVEYDIYFPTVGSMFFVSNHNSWWRTNIVTNILSRAEDDNGNFEIIFKTASGSNYKWTFDSKQI